ncbi:MAG: TPM domain-containing protein [Ramlibacter sp.]
MASLLLAAGFAQAQDLLPVPPLSARVIDSTGTLDAIQIKGLDEKLAGFEKEKGTQIAFLIVPSTQPEDIASYANRVGNAWKIGRKGVGDGLLLVVAKNDRKVRIEVAKTLEGAIPDLAAKQIIDDAITPNFRKGDYAGGLQAAADQIIARIKGEPLPAPEVSQPTSKKSGDGFNWTDLAIFLFFAVPVGGSVLRRIMGNKLGALVTGGGVGVLALLITSSLAVAGIAGIAALLFSLFSSFNPGGFSRTWSSGRGWSSGGGGFSSGSSGGGFSSGGGGDFGGGGASGDW